MTQKGNILFLVCKPCEEAKEADFGVKLAGRTQIGWYAHLVPGKQLDAWLSKHRNCAGRGKPDHFVLAHSFTPNYDQADLEVREIKKAVIRAVQ